MRESRLSGSMLNPVEQILESLWQSSYSPRATLAPSFTGAPQ
jgi:hypothetical protein